MAKSKGKWTQRAATGSRKRVTVTKVRERINKETGEKELVEVRTRSRLEYQLSEDRWERWYYAYVRQYEKRRQSKEKRGEAMFEELLSEEDYRRERTALINEGYTQNINRTIVQGQSSYMSLSSAKHLLELGEQEGLDFIYKTDEFGEKVKMTARELANTEPENLGLWDLQQQVDESVMDHIVSEINIMLKNAHPTWSGKQRGQWISHEVYGS